MTPIKSKKIANWSKCIESAHWIQVDNNGERIIPLAEWVLLRETPKEPNLIFSKIQFSIGYGEN